MGAKSDESRSDVPLNGDLANEGPSVPRRWWAPPAAPQAWLLRYGRFTEDSRVAWYCGAELLAAGLVTAMGSLAFEDVPFCVVRSVACCLVLSAQLGVLAVLRPQVHRWRWFVATAAAALQTASAALSTANAVVQEQRVELAMDVLAVAVFALMAAVTAAEAAAVLPTLTARLLETIKALRRHFASRRRRPQPLPQDSATSLEQRLLQQGGNDSDDEWGIAGMLPVKPSRARKWALRKGLLAGK